MKALQKFFMLSYFILLSSTLSASGITTVVDKVCVSGSACSPTVRIALPLPRWPQVQEDVYISVDAGAT